MSTPTPLDFTNIQGDVLNGLPKKFQSFLFFLVTNPTQFRQKFKDIVPLVTTTAQVQDDEAAIAAHKASGAKGLITIVGTNIAFSSVGLTTLGITPSELSDSLFTKGQRADAFDLADPGTGTESDFDPDWDPVFKLDIHGCFLVTGDSTPTIDQRIGQLQSILNGTFQVLARVDGAVRPGAESGHEHFGFKDGISNPPVIGGPRGPHTGEELTKPGIILLGEDGDDNNGQNDMPRPAWAKDSSFLVFRKLQQFVPEFNAFLAQNPIPGMPSNEGSELLGARLVGRWKSGAPIERSPLRDSQSDADDVNKVNDFDYKNDSTGSSCPFTAHLRKMNPRESTVGVGPGLQQVQVRRIIRQGIPYGPEVDKGEAASGKTIHDRGLLFACYQSNLSLGFQFLQSAWANNKDFPGSDQNIHDGFDAIIGQSLTESRFTTGANPQNLQKILPLPSQAFVKPRGGEFFLSPSISALKTKFASA